MNNPSIPKTDSTPPATPEGTRGERDPLDEKLLAEADPYGGVLGALKLCLIALSLEPTAPDREKTLRDAQIAARRAIKEAKLIADEPDLLEALERALDRLTKGGADEEDEDVYGEGCAAIEKARERQS